MQELVEQFKEALLTNNRLQARQVLTCNESDLPLSQMIEGIITPALDSIGREWEMGNLALSQVYLSGLICETLVDELLPSSGTSRKGTPLMAVAVLEDYHMLGKRIVYSTLRASGYDLLDYGRVSVDEVVARSHSDGVEVLLLSALMLPSALRVKNVRARLDEVASPVKIVVGGAPFRFDSQLWQEVGAHAMGRTASEAVAIVQSVVGGSL